MFGFLPNLDNRANIMAITIDDIINHPRLPISITTGEPIHIPKDREAMAARMAAQQKAMQKERERIEAGLPPGKYPKARQVANDNYQPKALAA